MNINVTLFAQAITFVLFILFTKKFVWPALMTVLDQRQKKMLQRGIFVVPLVGERERPMERLL